MDSYKKFMSGAQGGGYQKYMDWQKYMGGTGKNSSYHKYMDWSNGYQKYMDWQKYMGGGKNAAGGYQKYMDWQKYTAASSLNALPSNEHIGDSGKYTPQAKPLVLLLCAVSAF